MTPTVQTTIRLRLTAARALEAAARREGRPRNEIVNAAIHAYEAAAEERAKSTPQPRAESR